ncbi:MAG: arsenate reductase ArsC [candidate division NC10 bacterium]|nr:arsenate reductase ArsC [candidate division NC10 bacterium]
MAEGFLREMGEGRVDAASAGTRPREGVHPLAVAVMAERGIDISSQRAKGLDPAMAARMDLVVTVCDRAAAECPVFPPSIRTFHWPIDDPAAAPGDAAARLAAFRAARNTIERSVRDLLESLPASP